jgi:chromate reductase
MKVLAISGSLQAQSSNLALLRRAIERAPAGLEIVLDDHLRRLPPFDPDHEGEGAPPEVRSWRAALAGADALLIASPEYGHSLPGSLKNAIDWVIGSGELNRKLVAVTASAPGAGRGERGLRALCDTLRAVDARILGGDPIVRGPEFDAELDALLEALASAGPG